MSVQEFRKKVPSVQAILIDGTEANARTAAAWCKGSMSNAGWQAEGERIDRDGEWTVHVPTARGPVEPAARGDYIAKSEDDGFSVRWRHMFETDWEAVPNQDPVKPTLESTTSSLWQSVLARTLVSNRLTAVDLVALGTVVPNIWALLADVAQCHEAEIPGKVAHGQITDADVRAAHAGWEVVS